MKKVILPLLVFLTLSTRSFSQPDAFKPTLIVHPVYFDVSPPLREMAAKALVKADQTWKEGVVKNFFDIHKDQNKENLAPGYTDPVRQSYVGLTLTDTTLQNFEGVSNVNSVVPPDTYGDVGPNHYFQVVNLSYAIYNKSGIVLVGPVANSTVFSGLPNNSNDGDAVVLYDEQADRWLFSQFSLPNYPNSPFYQMIAVSQTPDPTGSWYRWEYTFTNMPDYPKFGIWPDGYYMSCNLFASGSGSFSGTGAAAFDRTAMLTGNASPAMIYFTLPSSNEAYSMIPSDCDGPFPAAGTPDYFTYIRTSSPYHLGIYEFHANWITPASSTLGNFVSLPVNTFSTTLSGIPQQGTTRILDPITDRLMYRVQYRKFSDHQSMVTNHTVNSGSSVAGVRWYELRNTGSGWSVYQQSTYSPDSKCRWMGSVAMDTSGNMALGYSISASNLYPSIRYTGRMNNDVLNTMTITEHGIINGAGSQTGIWSGRSRWGDYSGMSVDPSSPSTFWYTQEYYATTSDHGWQTRVGSFFLGANEVWSGGTSTDWNTASNWTPAYVPVSTSTVTIPSSIPNWPVYQGSLTVGTQCRNITINGGGQMTVNGNLTINQGYSVTMNGSPVLKISGNWTDYGRLNPGTGTIVFTGPGPSVITGGISPGTYIQNYLPTAFTQGMTAISGATTGPSGSNAAANVSIGFTFTYFGVNYTTIRICTNGWASLNLTGGTTNDNTTVFTTTAPNTTLAPWFDRITVDGTSSLSYKTEGTTPNRIFTVEWKNVPTYYTGATARINFQVKLYETMNVIEFQYGGLVAGTHNASESASVGIDDATGGSGHFIDATTGSTTTGISTLVSTTNWPAVNYRFTPPPLKETFYNLTNSKNNAIVTIQPDIIINGNLIFNQ